jgi:acetyl-CoA acetyltransferase
VIALDETPMKCDVSKITKLKPAFKKDGAVTPANSSSISDGAAAFVLMRESDAKSSRHHAAGADRWPCHLCRTNRPGLRPRRCLPSRSC